MDKQTIKEFVKDKHWYYYYNFDGIEVNAKKKKDKTLGLHNWKRLEPVMNELFSFFDKPHVLDIGCNMGLYDHEMSKNGAKVTAVDKNTEHIEFYKRYITENMGEEWNVDIKQIDLLKERLNVDSVDIISMFCVLYHLQPNQDEIISYLIEDVSSHKFLVLQGNIPRVVKNNQKEAGIDGMKRFLSKHNYSVFKVLDWNNYQKPVVIGEK